MGIPLAVLSLVLGYVIVKKMDDESLLMRGFLIVCLIAVVAMGFAHDWDWV